MAEIIQKSLFHTIGMAIVHSIFSIFILFSSIWFCFAIWVQQPFGQIFSHLIIGFWIIFALSLFGNYLSKYFFNRKISAFIYIIFFSCTLIWYFNISAKQDRQWSPEVSRILNYEKQGNLVTIHNVRNFNWHTETQFDERWESRKFNLDHITGVNIITSYWMGPEIAHTLVSFNFSDQSPLVFSLETRKEKTENFSAIGGFFRQFELSLLAADEKDIIYTRSNVRGEQVYFFPVQMPKAEAKALFEEYLIKSDQLTKKPEWYNTLTSNCTTLIFDMVQAISPQKLPLDYRLIASGYLPNYLYDLGALDHQWTMKQWYEKAHLNPRTALYAHFKYQNSPNYSKVVRYGLPEVPAQ